MRKLKMTENAENLLEKDNIDWLNKNSYKSINNEFDSKIFRGNSI